MGKPRRLALSRRLWWAAGLYQVLSSYHDTNITSKILRLSPQSDDLDETKLNTQDPVTLKEQVG